MSWQSPIDMWFSDMEMKLEGEVCRAVQRVGITVDKDELIKALEYDRGQYDKGYADGYADGKAEMVRCKDCEYHRYLTCANAKGVIGYVTDDDYCSYAVRREE